MQRPLILWIVSSFYRITGKREEKQLFAIQTMAKSDNWSELEHGTKDAY